MSTKISHSGVIERIESDKVQVRIVQTSACAACKVAGYCNAAESKEKIIDVFGDTSSKSYQVGQPVTVTTSGMVAVKALLWGFGLPFVLLVAVLVVVLLVTSNEGLAALCALGSLVPYYFLLWLLRNRMRDELSFQIATI
ncbi:MAG: RseC/MucC family positive regulator of sigma(E) [Prevotella sp.]|nr:RseC/MucC family positive regulator of sigma(E) [Prevotella sp.]